MIYIFNLYVADKLLWEVYKWSPNYRLLFKEHTGFSVEPSGLLSMADYNRLWYIILRVLIFNFFLASLTSPLLLSHRIWLLQKLQNDECKRLVLVRVLIFKIFQVQRILCSQAAIIFKNNITFISERSFASN